MLDHKLTFTVKMKKIKTEEKKAKKDGRKNVNRAIDRRTSTQVFINLIIAMVIMAYFCVVGVVYKQVDIEGIETTVKISTLVFLLISLILIERAYKKKSKKIVLHAFEILALAIHSLTTMYIIKICDFDFNKYVLISSYVFSIYYVLKCIIINTKARRDYLMGMSDITDIVQKDTPSVKEASKKEKKNKKNKENIAQANEEKSKLEELFEDDGDEQDIEELDVADDDEDITEIDDLIDESEMEDEEFINAEEHEIDEIEENEEFEIISQNEELDQDNAVNNKNSKTEVSNVGIEKREEAGRKAQKSKATIASIREKINQMKEQNKELSIEEVIEKQDEKINADNEGIEESKTKKNTVKKANSKKTTAKKTTKSATKKTTSKKKTQTKNSTKNQEDSDNELEDTLNSKKTNSKAKLADDDKPVSVKVNGEEVNYIIDSSDDEKEKIEAPKPKKRGRPKKEVK